ncbi:MAG: hypothetical protein PHS80_03525 [Methanothrix sp.]|nr:hypothetical protein [Methanothrix sp.]MDD4448154.1 hypothetical protein [Methanothrix sp.]
MLGRILLPINQAFRIFDGIPLAPGGRARVGAGRRARVKAEPQSPNGNTIILAK